MHLLIDAPVKETRETQALADEAGLNAKIDRIEIDLPLWRVGVQHDVVVGPRQITFMQRLHNRRTGTVVHYRKHHPDVDCRTTSAGTVAEQSRARGHRNQIVDAGLVHVGRPLLNGRVEVGTAADLVSTIVEQREPWRLSGSCGRPSRSDCRASSASAVLPRFACVTSPCTSPIR